jgi:hypothetical protein
MDEVKLSFANTSEILTCTEQLSIQERILVYYYNYWVLRGPSSLNKLGSQKGEVTSRFKTFTWHTVLVEYCYALNASV